MNILSVGLQAKIETLPTNTVLRSESKSVDDVHRILLKSTDIKDPNLKIPEIFDGRKVWKGLITKPKNQGTCGSCWAFATTSTLADRFNIQSMGLLNVDLSATKLILCDQQGKEYDIVHPELHTELVDDQEFKTTQQSACFGSSLIDAWRYLYIIGTNTSKCVPYDKNYGQFKELTGIGSFTTPEKMPICSEVSGILGDMCSDFTFDTYSSSENGNPARFYKTLHIYAIAGTEKDGGSEKNIRYNIYHWGPVSSGMKVYSDFYTFDPKKDIYKWNGQGPQVGGHAIEIVGWGEENNIPYWIIKNSWGEKWGDGGYFRMIRGSNNCEIEENIVTGIPDFFYPLQYETPVKYIWTESEKSKQKRIQIATLVSEAGGGINPETGYTRRVMATMPWIDFERPVKLVDLPDFSKWVAGIDANVRARSIYKNIVESKYEDLIYGNQTLYTVTTILSILLVLLLVVVIIYHFKHARKHT